jgi:transposase-like protein
MSDSNNLLEESYISETADDSSSDETDNSTNLSTVSADHENPGTVSATHHACDHEDGWEETKGHMPDEEEDEPEAEEDEASQAEEESEALDNNEGQPAGSVVITPENVRKRKSFTIEWKVEVAKQVNNNTAEIARRYGIGDRLLRGWVSSYKAGTLVSKNQTAAATSKRQPGGGRKPSLSADIEHEIWTWVADCRDQHLIVSRHDIMQLAKALAGRAGLDPRKHVFGDRWLRSFCDRHGLTLRRSSSHVKLPDQLVVERGLAFKSFMDRYLKGHAFVFSKMLQLFTLHVMNLPAVCEQVWPLMGSRG